ncbi:MAG TPA: hypothetical protein VFH11_09510 [Gemmatimonadota bacterium]|nr:hypothetical protein [Gemmatimonadota bacterium]
MHRTSALVALCLSLVAAVAIGRPAIAQQDTTAQAQPVADPADVESIDAIIAALYDVISGPAGERDWQRFRSLFAPNATLAPMVPRPDGSLSVRVISPDRYVEWGSAFFTEHAFYEREAGRKLERFGNVANAMSFYESRHAPDEEPFTRGVNTITLLHDGTRWYVLSIAWDEVREGLPAPDYGD